MTHSKFEELRAALHGELRLPDDTGYDDDRHIWNAMIEKKPLAIAKPSGARDVATCIKFARAHDIPVSVRAGGHNVSGKAIVDAGLVIDLRSMRNVTVDPGAKTAWVGGGCTLADVDHETQQYGLAAPLGIVSDTGVAGLTLHGGLGYLRRKHGLACDAVRTYEIVTASGEIVRASQDQNPDLFWAMRGAGSNFGVVTGFEFELYPLGPQIVQLGVMYPIERTRKYLKFWRDFMADSPPELVSNFLMWSMPDWDVLPEPVRGRDVCIFGGCWIGDVDDGLDYIQPLRELETPLADLSGAMSYNEIQTGFDPFFVSGERHNYWKSAYADRLDDNVIAFLAEKGMNRPDPWSLIAIWHMGGGALLDVGPQESAFGDRSAPFMVSYDSSTPDERVVPALIDWTREAWRETRQFSASGGGYMNFAGLIEEGDDLLSSSHGAENLARLKEIKAKWDPENLFRSNANIAPAAS